MPLIRRFVEIFSQYEAIVSPSASCVGMVRDMYRFAAEVHQDTKLANEVALLAERVYEFSEFIVNRLGIEDVGAYYPHRVTYHPTCHSLRGIKVGDAPEQLLRAVRGIDYVPMTQSNECCGFGGTFAVKNADTSMAMLGDKIRHILDTRAEVCVAADNSCLMHIGGALHRQRSGVRIAHLAEILAAQE
jgi:L-lactate dehydrogenase complex protein LldE